MKFFYILALLAITAISGCSWTVRDGAPGRFIDVDAVPDVIPRDEPLSKSGNAESYEIDGKRYYTLNSNQGFSQSGIASWYGTKFHGRPTASGEPYDMYKMTAAHKTLPIPSYVQVTNEENGKTMVVRINDRGPFVSGRIIDLSYAAAIKLGVDQTGTARVNIQAITTSATKSNKIQADSGALAPAKVITPGQQTPEVEVKPIAAVNPTVMPSKTGGLQNNTYFLQVGSFANQDNAQTLVRKLIEHTNTTVQIVPSQTSAGKMYRVRVGPFAQRDEVSKVQDQLSQTGLVEKQLVVRTP